MIQKNKVDNKIAFRKYLTFSKRRSFDVKKIQFWSICPLFIYQISITPKFPFLIAQKVRVIVIYGPVFGNVFYFLKLVMYLNQPGRYCIISCPVGNEHGTIVKWRGSYGRMVSIIQHSWEVLLITDINHLHAKCLEMAFWHWSLLWSFTNNSNTSTIKGWEFSTEALFFTLNSFPLSD